MTTVEINDVVALRTDNRLLQMIPRDLVAAADAIKTEVVEHPAAMNSAQLRGLLVQGLNDLPPTDVRARPFRPTK
jgi:hypothetical protein